jgi:hypothetical protein
MVTDTINKNMLLKTVLLNKRFGLFKSIVIRNRQLTTFLISSNKKVIEINYCTSKKKKITKIKILLNYLYYNRDIWCGNKILYDCFKTKAIEFASMKPIVFNKYLLLFGYNYPYPKNDGSICLEHVSSDRLCDCHKEIIPRVKSEILSGLTTFPKDICDIVFKFTMCYKQH